jgi:hypothetical protein
LTSGRKIVRLKFNKPPRKLKNGQTPVFQFLLGFGAMAGIGDGGQWTGESRMARTGQDIIFVLAFIIHLLNSWFGFRGWGLFAFILGLVFGLGVVRVYS